VYVHNDKNSTNVIVRLQTDALTAHKSNVYNSSSLNRSRLKHRSYILETISRYVYK